MALKQTTNRDGAAKSARAFRRCGLPLLVSVLLTAICLSAVRLAPTSFAQEGAQGRGSRPAGVTPKRQSPRARTQADGASSKGTSQANSAEMPRKPSARAVASSALEALSPLLAVADFDLVGLAVTADPPSQTVPKNTPTSVLVSVKVPEGTDPAPIIAGLNPEYRVRGELTGPSFSGPRTIEAPVGQPLPIPPLAQAGEHLLQNLRVVDTGRPEQPSPHSWIRQTLGEAGFTRTKVSNSAARNETWNHADGSEVRIHPYGNEAQAPYKTANNAHVHKVDAAGNNLKPVHKSDGDSPSRQV